MRGAAMRILTLAGIVAPVVYAGAVIYCGAMRPGYDHVTRFMSELAERGSSTEMTMRVAGFYIPGLLILAFAASLLKRPVAWPVALLLVIHGIGRVTAGVFPCDAGCPAAGASFSQMMHNGAAAVNALTVPAAATIWFFSARTAGRRRFALYSLVSAIAGLVFLVLMLMDAVTRVHVGLYQRLSFGIMTLWIGALAVSLWPTGSAVADRQDSL
jgi:hypothetical membrane protein